MASILSAQSGNFSSPTTWVGGVVPGPSDEVILTGGHQISADVDIEIVSLTHDTLDSTLLITTNRTFTGDIICQSSNFVIVKISGTDIDVVINGNINTLVSTALHVISTGNLTINGNILILGYDTSLESIGSIRIESNNLNFYIFGDVYGQARFTPTVNFSNSNNLNIFVTGTVYPGVQISTGSGYTFFGSGNANININGDIASLYNLPEGWAINTSGNTNVTITGNILSYDNYTNIISIKDGNITVTGNIYATSNFSNSSTLKLFNDGLIQITGQIFSSGSLVHAVETTSTNTLGLILDGNQYDAPDGTRAAYVNKMRVRSSQNSFTQYANATGFPSGNPVIRANLSTTGDHPLISDVRNNVDFAENQFTGTMNIPNANSVSYGVPVDNTFGTAVITPVDVWAALLGDLTTNNSIGNLVKNSATVEVVGALISTYND